MPGADSTRPALLDVTKAPRRKVRMDEQPMWHERPVEPSPESTEREQRATTDEAGDGSSGARSGYVYSGLIRGIEFGLRARSVARGVPAHLAAEHCRFDEEECDVINAALEDAGADEIRDMVPRGGLVSKALAVLTIVAAFSAKTATMEAAMRQADEEPPTDVDDDLPERTTVMFDDDNKPTVVVVEGRAYEVGDERC